MTHFAEIDRIETIGTNVRGFALRNVDSHKKTDAPFFIKSFQSRRQASKKVEKFLTRIHLGPRLYILGQETIHMAYRF